MERNVKYENARVFKSSAAGGSIWGHVEQAQPVPPGGGVSFVQIRQGERRFLASLLA